jgi:hypothetical protein
VTIRTRSFTETLSLSARSLPMTMPGGPSVPGASASRLPACIDLPTLVTVGSSAGTTPLTWIGASCVEL